MFRKISIALVAAAVLGSVALAPTSASLKAVQQELEQLFIATDEREDKKLEIIGWKGPKVVIKAFKRQEFFKGREVLCSY
jgi:hypothetical protein